MRKRFVADVSHELKTPITSILGYSDTLIENDVDPETSKKFLQRISSEAERMARLVSDLLVLSRYDTSKVKVEKSDLQPGDLVFPSQDHVAIYIGNNQIIHAPQTGKNVEICNKTQFNISNAIFIMDCFKRCRKLFNWLFS